MIKKTIICVFLCLFLLPLEGCHRESQVQWALHNTGQVIEGVKGVKGVDISFPLETSLVLDKPAENIIGVVDTNINFNSKYLYGTACKKSYLENDIESFIHGTAVTGIIVGKDREYRSILDNANIYSIPFDVNNFEIETVIEKLREAELDGCKVINCSFTLKNYNELLYKFMKNSSMLFVCAVGNENKEQLDYPAAYGLDNLISVIGINNMGYCSKYSNYSCDADIAAPGENILCIGKNDELEYMSGSSFAAPFVTAACIYIIDQTGCTSEEAKDILVNNSEVMDSLKKIDKDGRILCFEKVIKYIDEMK